MSRDFVGALLQLNAEKQVSREQLIRTVEEAIAAAYRRVANEEDIHVHIDADSGAIRVYRARIATTDPIEEDEQLTHFTLDEARRHKADAMPGRARRDRAAGRRHVRAHRRPDRQAGRPPAPPRGGARRRVRPVRGPRGRARDRHGQPRRAAGDDPGHGQGRRGHPRHDRAVAARALPHRPERQGLRARGPAHAARAGAVRQPHPQGLPQAPVRARGPRDPQRHGRDPGHRPRGRQPLEGRRRVAPGRASIRSARPSASAARASRPSSPSSAARRST